MADSTRVLASYIPFTVRSKGQDIMRHTFAAWLPETFKTEGKQLKVSEKYSDGSTIEKTFTSKDLQ